MFPNTELSPTLPLLHITSCFIINKQVQNNNIEWNTAFIIHMKNILLLNIYFVWVYIFGYFNLVSALRVVKNSPIANGRAAVNN